MKTNAKMSFNLFNDALIDFHKAYPNEGAFTFDREMAFNVDKNKIQKYVPEILQESASSSFGSLMAVLFNALMNTLRALKINPEYLWKSCADKSCSFKDVLELVKKGKAKLLTSDSQSVFERFIDEYILGSVLSNTSENPYMYMEQKLLDGNVHVYRALPQNPDYPCVLYTTENTEQMIYYGRQDTRIFSIEMDVKTKPHICPFRSISVPCPFVHSGPLRALR